MTGRTRIALHGGIATLAASSALLAVFDSLAWLFPVAVAIAIVVAVGELLRRSPVPAALGPIIAAAGVLCELTQRYTSDSAFWGFLPTRTSLGDLGTIVRSGFTDVRKLAPPVPAHPGLVVLAVVGVAAVALLVDLLAVTMRHAALAGLPLLAVFVTGTSVARHGAGLLSFILASTGFLWLLLADSRDRLSRWGRSLGFDRATRPRLGWADDEVMPSPLAVMGRRVGFVAIVVGILVPVVVPGLRGGIPRGGNGIGFGRGNGSSTAVTVNPIVGIRAQLTSARAQPLLTVLTDDADPGYLRLTALDQFDGSSFSPSTLVQPTEAQVSRGIAAPPVQGRKIRIDVRVAHLAVHWLPLPVQVTAVDVPGDWRYDGRTNTVFSARADTDSIEYTAQITRPEPSPQALEAAGPPETAMNRYLTLPHIPKDVVKLTASVTRSAKTPFDKAVAIQNFLRGPTFGYDISVAPSASTNALEDFLLHTRRGFCQQYASAMAVMARIAGIPSRVAVGFTRGDKQSGGSWLVTTHDAHAWPELYFGGYGWLAFEPTPRGDGQAEPPSYTNPPGQGTDAGGANGGRGNPNGKTSTPKGPGGSGLRFLHGDNGKLVLPPAPPVPKPKPRSHRGELVLALLVLVALALVAPSVVRVVSRRRRWARAATARDRAEAAWTELRASAIDARIGWVDGLSPRATARLLRADAGLDKSASASLDHVVDVVQRAWYAADPGAMSNGELRHDVDAIRLALFEDTTGAERFVLRAWPRSTLLDVRRATARVGEALDVVDLAGARMRARLRPHHN